jgi:hypothetical protein
MSPLNWQSIENEVCCSTLEIYWVRVVTAGHRIGSMIVLPVGLKLTNEVRIQCPFEGGRGDNLHNLPFQPFLEGTRLKLH